MDQIKIGKFIAELRKEKKLSQAKLGVKLGVTNKTISRWENGNYMPDISLMLVISQEFEININELISGERLNDQLFRQHADINITTSLEQQKQLKRKKAITSFLQGGGTGILISTLYSPDSIRRTVAIIIAIIMILISWYREKKISF
ncbi:MAG: helix-turn-helix transcriptional regulator [Lachnospiraceae bacterium]